ncbi:unnamed protein product, partial [Brassica napus]
WNLLFVTNVYIYIILLRVHLPVHVNDMIIFKLCHYNKLVISSLSQLLSITKPLHLSLSL